MTQILVIPYAVPPHDDAEQVFVFPSRDVCWSDSFLAQVRFFPKVGQDVTSLLGLGMTEIQCGCYVIRPDTKTALGATAWQELALKLRVDAGSKCEIRLVSSGAGTLEGIALLMLHEREPAPTRFALELTARK